MTEAVNWFGRCELAALVTAPVRAAVTPGAASPCLYV